MSTSVAGSLLLLLIGVAFLCAALAGWWRAGKDPSSRRRHLVAVVVDLLVGFTALADGTVSSIDEPDRVVVWSIGSAALVVAVALLLVRRRQGHDLHR
jgi:peptidoglycan/LPS O-acetylase OafA/YrhL